VCDSRPSIPMLEASQNPEVLICRPRQSQDCI
jgi:hypothetical protein